jgi:hypothetical protein
VEFFSSTALKVMKVVYDLSVSSKEAEALEK